MGTENMEKCMEEKQSCIKGICEHEYWYNKLLIDKERLAMDVERNGLLILTILMSCLFDVALIMVMVFS